VIRYVGLEPKYADALEELERTSFPTADEEGLLKAESVLLQCERFPEGGFVVLDGDEVVGMAMGIFVDFDFAHPQHSLIDVVGHHGSEKHDEFGAWYYGTDIAVSPAYRGRGIGRKLYDLRKDLVRRRNRAGIVAGGVIPGFADHKHEMTAEEYVAKVVAGELTDPTLTFQLANGFEARGAIADYWGDPAVDDWASLIVWPNPDHDAEQLASAKRAARGA
jgi:GNAT superfamily N-acetyltransferase